MSMRVHICANKGWGGAETRAALAAQAPEVKSVVICSDAERILKRMQCIGLTAFGCKMSGMFASVNLSRVLRHLPERDCEIIVHSPEIRNMVTSAVQLSGRKDLTVANSASSPCFPPVTVEKPAPDDDCKLLMWLGRITPECGLIELINALGKLSSHWRLRVVGEGDASVVMPMVNRARALGIDKQIEWGGYTDNVYSQMNGVSFGIVTRPNPSDRTVTREFAAASIPVIAAADSSTLYSKLKEALL